MIVDNLDLRVRNIMGAYEVDVSTAKTIAEVYDFGLNEGKKQGREEAQRFMRLALGVEEPTLKEESLWNNPIPLKETKDD